MELQHVNLFNDFKFQQLLPGRTKKTTAKFNHNYNEKSIKITGLIRFVYWPEVIGPVQQSHTVNCCTILKCILTFLISAI